jgi:hypothetical protein
VIDLWSSWSDGQIKATVLKTGNMEVMRLHVARHANVPTYEAQGEITILCNEGHVVIHTHEQGMEFVAGQMLYLLVNAPFTIEGMVESSLLITILRPAMKQGNAMIGN